MGQLFQSLTCSIGCAKKPTTSQSWCCTRAGCRSSDTRWRSSTQHYKPFRSGTSLKKLESEISECPAESFDLSPEFTTSAWTLSWSHVCGVGASSLCPLIAKSPRRLCSSLSNPKLYRISNRYPSLTTGSSITGWRSMKISSSRRWDEAKLW